MEKSINAQMRITGLSEKKDSITKFINPTIKPCNVTPNFTVASIDIETGAKTNQLYSIAVHVTGKKDEQKRVFMIGEETKRSLKMISYFSDERILLEKFL